MKSKTMILSTSVGGGLMVSFFINLSSESLVIIWLAALVISFGKLKNHFISLLLMLEMFSLSSLIASSFYVKMSGALSLMFILMSLSVGEAVLGLAILVKLVRLNASELVLSGLL